MRAREAMPPSVSKGKCSTRIISLEGFSWRTASFMGEPFLSSQFLPDIGRRNYSAPDEVAFSGGRPNSRSSRRTQAASCIYRRGGGGAVDAALRPVAGAFRCDAGAHLAHARPNRLAVAVLHRLAVRPRLLHRLLLLDRHRLPRRCRDLSVDDAVHGRRPCRRHGALLGVGGDGWRRKRGFADLPASSCSRFVSRLRNGCAATCSPAFRGRRRVSRQSAWAAWRNRRPSSACPALTLAHLDVGRSTGAPRRTRSRPPRTDSGTCHARCFSSWPGAGEPGG